VYVCVEGVGGARWGGGVEEAARIFFFWLLGATVPYGTVGTRRKL
jgi:hypothetical protein